MTLSTGNASPKSSYHFKLLKNFFPFIFFLNPMLVGN